MTNDKKYSLLIFKWNDNVFQYLVLVCFESITPVSEEEGDSLILIQSLSWTFISLLEVGISLFLNLISYLSFSP